MMSCFYLWGKELKNIEKEMVKEVIEKLSNIWQIKSSGWSFFRIMYEHYRVTIAKGILSNYILRRYVICITPYNCCYLIIILPFFFSFSTFTFVE